MAPLTAAPLFATLTDNFDTQYAGATLIQEGSGPAPTIVGGVLHLLNEGSNGQLNRYVYPTTDFGAYDTITASFNFQLTSPDQAADGLHFALLPTSIYGTSGGLAAAVPGVAEEPNIPSAFAVGIDVYDGGVNDVSAHWNGIEVINTRPNDGVATPADHVINLDNGALHTALIELQRVGNSTNVKVTMTPGEGGPAVTLINQVMPMMQPYQNRVEFGGRTGGLNLSADIDNLNVQYSNTYVAPATSSVQGMNQDFDQLGTTNFTAFQQNQTGNNATQYIPGPRNMPADAGSSGVFMRIAQDGSPNNNNRIALDRAFDAGVAPQTSLQFDFRSTSGDQPADGFSFLMLPTASQGRSGAGIGASEVPNAVGMFGIGFDTYPNNGSENGNQITLNWNNATIATNQIPSGTFNINNGLFNQTKVDLVQVPGGTNVSVTITPNINGTPGTPVQVFTNQFVPGMTPYDYRPQFTSRTGGADASVDLDNIKTAAFTPAAGPGLTTQKFEDGSGTFFKAYTLSSGLSPEIKNDGPVGVGSYLRLMHDGQGGQANTLVLNQGQTGITTTSTITGELDFKLSSADTPADGFSVMLLPTDTYGSSGPGLNVASPRPNVGGVFAVGFDIYDNDGAGGAESDNNISLHFGTQLTNFQLDPGLLNLDSGAWNHMALSLVPDGSGNTLVSLTLTPDYFGSPGTPVNVFTNYLVTGMVPKDFRVQLGAASGGADASLDLDNIVFVPEPAVAMLGLLGMGAGLRRKRKQGSRFC